MFQGPLVPTAVTRAKQGRVEIDDTGLIPSFIRDVIFQGFGICFGLAASLHFQWDINTFLVHFLLNDWRFTPIVYLYLKGNPDHNIRWVHLNPSVFNSNFKCFF